RSFRKRSPVPHPADLPNTRGQRGRQAVQLGRGGRNRNRRCLEDVCDGLREVTVKKALVGLDVGTSAVKGIAISPDGDVIASAEEHYTASSPRDGWSEQDPEDWLHASQSALAQLDVEPLQVGFSGQMHGLVCLDGSGNRLRPAILWNDQRTGAECVEI